MMHGNSSSAAQPLQPGARFARERDAAPGRWHRSPILWLGIAMLAASIAGCVLTVVLALRYAETPLSVDGERLLKVPAAHAAPIVTIGGRTPGDRA